MESIGYYTQRLKEIMESEKNLKTRVNRVKLLVYQAVAHDVPVVIWVNDESSRSFAESYLQSDLGFDDSSFVSIKVENKEQRLPSEFSVRLTDTLTIS
jgi:hypothetical protein